jgi:hypothetical protein
MKKKEQQPDPKPFTGWALYNWGNPWGVHRTRREAIEEATRALSEPWSKCRKSFRVAKVSVRPAHNGNGDA